MKILLFDIDGTLLYPGKTPRKCINRALSEFIGEEIRLPIEKLAGFTDPVIVRNALRENGFHNGALRKSVKTVLNRYLELLRSKYPFSADNYLYPNVLETLKRIKDNPDYKTGLLTGNHIEGARIKLAPFKIWNFFETGAFGDDAEDRAGLPPVAINRFEEKLKYRIHPREVVIIGDTHRDIQAARENGVKSVAVIHNSGWREAILTEHPDLVIDGFHETDKLFQWLEDN